MNSLPENEHLSVLLLSQKLATLLALTAASRCSEICILDTRYMVQGENYYRFHFSKLFKSWLKGKPAPSIEYSSYFENSELCVEKALDQYLFLVLGVRTPKIPTSSGQCSASWRDKKMQGIQLS